MSKKIKVDKKLSKKELRKELSRCLECIGDDVSMIEMLTQEINTLRYAMMGRYVYVNTTE